MFLSHDVSVQVPGCDLRRSSYFGLILIFVSTFISTEKECIQRNQIGSVMTPKIVEIFLHLGRSMCSGICLF